MQDLFSQRMLRKRFGIRRSPTKLLATAAMLLFFGVIAAFLSVGLLFAWYAKDLPRPDKVRRVEGLSTVILDRNGKDVYNIYEDENRIPVSINDVPQYLRDATISIEDKDFYTHQGLSTTGIFRAFINIVVFRNFQGGSTLTQQLVKNALLTTERTLPRKIKEAILAIQIERKYSKDEILQMYLNETPYGGTAVGAEAGAKYYFDKPVRDLNLVESAILAGIAQAPGIHSPFGNNPKAYITRTQDVLRRMREDGHITPLQETEARAQLDGVKFATGETGLKAPHFVAYVKQQLIETFGNKVVDAGGLKVTTSLDLDLQEEAQSIVKEEVDKVKRLQVSNGAAVVINPQTGEILAMVGSKDYASTDSGGFKFNVVTQGLRQPGSTIKPITYAAAFKKGYTPSTALMDVETTYPSGDVEEPEYKPKNYDGKYRGLMQLRPALGNSINTIAVKVSALVGIKDVLRLAYDMGLSTLEPTNDNLKRFGLSLTLGGGEVTLLELTSAFGVFANAGNRMETISILKVEDSNGKVLYEYKPPAAKRVLGEDIAYLISNILSDNSARNLVFGERSQLVIPGRTVAVKTGTTDDKRDNWTVGYAKSVVVGVWVGNNDNSPMHPSLASGVTGAAPIWSRIIREALKDVKDEQFSRPGNIVEMDIDAFGGGLPVDGYPTRKEIFIKGTEPNGPAPIYQKLKVSKNDSSKLANPIEVGTGQYDEKSFVVLREEDPVSSDGKNRWQEAIDAWISSQGDSKYKAPTETSQTSDEIFLKVEEPKDQSQINTNEVRVRAQAESMKDISKIEVFVDNVLVRERSGKSIDEDVNVNNGVHVLKIKATDSSGKTAHNEIRIGVNQPWGTPTPTPEP